MPQPRHEGNGQTQDANYQATPGTGGTSVSCQDTPICNISLLNACCGLLLMFLEGNLMMSACMS